MMAMKPKGKASGAASAAEHGYQAELNELQGLLRTTKDPELQQAAWDMSLKKLYNDFPMMVGKQSYNLAPNAPLKVFQKPDGTIIRVPAGKESMVPEGSQLLNKSEMDVFKLLPPKPGMKEPTPPLGTIGTALGVGTVAPAALAYQAGMGSENPPSPGVSTEPVSPQSTNYFVEKARTVLGGPYYGSDDAQPGAAYDGMRMAPDAGSPYVGSPYRVDEGSPFEGFTPTTEGSPYVGSPNAAAVQRALTASRGAGDRGVSSTQMTAAPSADPSALASFIRGRFGDAAKGSPMEDRLTAAQEARDKMGEGRASGGSVDGKPPKDAALHKALEIIHHLISRG